MEKTLEQLIPEYFGHKTEMDKHKKIVDKDKELIKQLMLQNDLVEIEVEGIIAKYSESVRSCFNDEALVEKLKELGCHGVIKTVEVADEDALEDALYNGQILPSQLASCQENKTVVTLKVFKKK